MSFIDQIKTSISSDREALACFDRLISMIRSGTLAAEFRDDRWAVIACVLTVIATVTDRLAQLADEDHAHPVYGAEIFDVKAGDLANAMGVNVPVARSTELGGGVLLKMLLPVLIDALADLMRKWLEDS